MKDALSKDSPKTKTKKVLRHLAGNNSSLNKVRRSLEFHYALIKQLRLKYKLKENKKKVSHAVIGSVIRKYKALSYIRSEIGIRNPSKDDRMKKKGTTIKRMRVDVHQYFERDDNSRITTGVCPTVTKLEDKRQKRLLLDTIENLYEKYRREAKEAISFTTFWRLKPFWVKQKTEKERETCLCKTCENLTFMAIVLYKHKVIKTFNIEVLVTQVVCNPNNKDCMFGNCSSCKEKQVETNIEDFNTEMSWNRWKTEKGKRTFKNGEIKEVTVPKKTQENGSLGHLMDRFHDDLWIKG
ncbi:hypothetical protein ACJMK2_037596 [Sinanodonta woodiana]|uniref:Uncharacterized protein n=1 Tax=Sinanodonta woodiana TaxID=1069815 RepID=A0ABD3WN12_SINWO